MHKTSTITDTVTSTYNLVSYLIQKAQVLELIANMKLTTDNIVEDEQCAKVLGVRYPTDLMKHEEGVWDCLRLVKIAHEQF